MVKTTAVPMRVPPKAFDQHRRAAFERTVQLTQKGIAQLKARSQTVTLAALSEATRSVDEQGKGLGPNTILRNPQAAQLFRQASPAYQACQHRARSAKRKRPRVTSDVRATYRGLRPADLIPMIEGLKTQLVELKAHQERLQAERDEAYQLRDQALRQNVRQLAALTKATTRMMMGKPHAP